MKRKKWLKFALPGLLMAGAVAYLFYSGMQKSMVFYLTLAELETQGGEMTGKAVRLAGRIKAGSVNRPSSRNGTMTFLVTDGKRDLPVTYTGLIPETFQEEGEVLVEGKWAAAPVFEATTLIPKCPSKYQVALEEKEKEKR